MAPLVKTGLVEIPNVRRGVVAALMRRDLRMYFSNPSGYVFLTLFILLSAAAAFWQDRFFLNNLATLDQLNGLFPYILLFFIPALTMSVWAEEKKLGTDELLLTLPATDLEIVLGKYAAVLGIYGAALVLSLSHALVLMFLGSPDWGLLFANYVGYALLGAALAAAGMTASLLTSIPTVAFILGAVATAVLVLPGLLFGSFSPWLARMVEPVSAIYHFEEFGRGVIPFTSVLYFVAVAGFFLYLNVLLIGKRHWPAAADGYRMSTHHAVRAVSVALALLSAIVLISRLGFRLDTTAERLHSLSGETRALLRALPDDRPVFVQAYLSPEVPEPLVQTRATLMSVLREMESVSGGRVQVLVEDTEPFTASAREAREKFGLMPREIPSVSSARTGVSDVFMGVAFTCAAEEQVIPFFDRGLPVEYELARSIRVVANTEKKRIGVISKELRIFGGLDFQTMRSSPEWSVVDELRKQYEVVQIQPNSMITEEVDGLLVVLPSTLADDEMNNVTDFIRAGVPAAAAGGSAAGGEHRPRSLRAAGSGAEPLHATGPAPAVTEGEHPVLPGQPRDLVGPGRNRLGRLQPASGSRASSSRGGFPRRGERQPGGLRRCVAGERRSPAVGADLSGVPRTAGRVHGRVPAAAHHRRRVRRPPLLPDGAAEFPGFPTEPQPAAPAGPDDLRGRRRGADLPPRFGCGHGG